MKKIIAGFSLIAMIVVLPAAVPLLGLMGENEQPENTGSFLVLAALFTFSAGTLWVWMVFDYKAFNKDMKHRILWGLGLFIANWAAAVLYFIFIYSPREKSRLILR